MEEQEEIAVIFNQLTESVRKYDGIACNIKIYLGKSSLMWFLYILKLRGEAITKKRVFCFVSLDFRNIKNVNGK